MSRHLGSVPGGSAIGSTTQRRGPGRAASSPRPGRFSAWLGLGLLGLALAAPLTTAAQVADPALGAALASMADDPKALRELSAELMRAGRHDDATLVLERALVAERGQAASATGSSLTLPATLTIGGLSVVLLGLLVFRAKRARGDLAVAIDYQTDRRGRFSVRLSRKREGQRGGVDPEHGTRAGVHRASSRYEHTQVGRETQFRGIPARTYYVYLEGVIDDPTGGAGATIYEVHEVFIGAGQSVRIEFDLRPSECPLDIQVLRRNEPAAGVRVALKGEPETVIPAESGAVRLPLPLGSHQIVVGAEDRVAEREVVIENHDPQTLVIDLDDGDGLIFRGCEAAVDAYLRGDSLLASNALERGGQRQVAHLLRAELHQERGELESAALQFESAGRLEKAAEVFESSGIHERAAVLYERVGQPTKAAEMHRAAGDQVRAGRCYEAAGDLANAATCYRDAEAVPKLIDVLEKLGDHFEAGRLAFEREEVARAVRNLQQVDPRNPGYTQACRLLAQTFLEQERIELAIQKADEAITFASDEEAGSDLMVWYGNLLDQAGRTDRALRVFQDLAARNPEDDDLYARIGRLEEKISKEQLQGAGANVVGPQAPGKESSRYELLEEVGRGGMGIVYKARDRRLGRIVALKRLPDNLKDHPRAVDLFLREARSAAALNHPNIVTVHDVDQEGGVYFLTMELLKGAPFHLILKKRGRLSGLDAARLGVQIAQGLGYAHDRGIVHRDIKTANLFFTNDKVVKIMDFGLAKMLEEVRRASTQITGTPYYMAPEQATGIGVDHRVDLYAFGVTLFELLTGTLPFMDGDILFQHREAPPPDPRELIKSVPPAMAALVLRLMAKTPDERGESAGGVAEELQAIVDEVAARAQS